MTRPEAEPLTGWSVVFHAIARNAITPDRTPLTFGKAIGWIAVFISGWLFMECLIAVVRS